MSGMTIRTNVSALVAQRNLGLTNFNLQNSIQRLSSGLRINRAGDDAAGLAISERMRTQTLGLDQAKRNAQDAVSLVQVAEGGITQIAEILQRMRVLAIQAANDSNTTADRQLIQVEINALVDEIDRQASATQFNGQRILTGAASSLIFQVGANTGDTLSISIGTVSSTALGVSGLKITDPLNTTSGGYITRAGAQSAITTLNSGIALLNSKRGELGAQQNRLENLINFIGISTENANAAQSRIRDLDYSQEIANFTKLQVLQQSGISALTQANLSAQAVLQLLQG